MKKILIALLVLLMVLGTVAGCGGQPSGEGGAAGTSDTLTVAAGAGPKDFAPYGSTDLATNGYRYQIYEALVNVGVDGEVTPGLATAWEWADNTTLLFTIREGVTFHNGNDLTADDVIFSLQKALDSSYTGGTVEGIIVNECKVQEDGRVLIKLEKPLTAVLARLSRVCISDKETWDEIGEEKLALEPNGTGPYKYANFVQSDRVEFVANEEYWDGAPAFKNLTIRIIPESSSRALELEAGTVDVSLNVQPSDIAVLGADENIDVHTGPSFSMAYFGFDANVAPYSDKRVRQALSYAIDRDAICEIAYSGLATPAYYGRMSAVHEGYIEEGVTRYTYDPEKAKALLAEAGYADGFDMEIIVTEAEQDQLDISELLLNQLEQVGINVKLQIMEDASFLNKIVDGGFDAFLLSTSGFAGDAGEVNKSFISDSPTWINTTRYQNEELSELIRKGQSTIDDAQRAEIFNQVQRIVADECPWVFLVHQQATFATRANIEGLQVYPSTLLYYKEAKPAQ